MIDLISNLPQMWHEVKEMKAIQDTASLELNVQVSDMNDLFSQCYIATTTWGLDLWEKELGIITNTELTDSDRRIGIITRLLGTTTSTVKLIKTLSEKITGGKCIVIENNANYEFVVHFTKPYGTPNNLTALTFAIEECKPAHLNFGYTYTYAKWSEILPLTWGQAREKTWGQIKIYEGDD